MTINNKSNKRNKGNTFKVDIENNEEHVENDTNDKVSNSIILAKRFGKIMKRLYQKKEMNQTKEKESSVMNANGLDTFRRSIPISLGNKRRNTLPHYQMKNLKRIVTGKRPITWFPSQHV